MSVFYDVLMEKSAQKQEQERSTAKGLALGTAGAALGIGAAHAGEKALGRAADALYRRSLKYDMDGARSVYNAIDRDKFDVVTSADAKEYFERGESPFESLLTLVCFVIIKSNFI